MDYILKIRSIIVEDIEESLKSINFAKLSKIKEKLLTEMLKQRKLNKLNKSRDLDLDELDQVVAAKGEKWRPQN